MEREQPKPKKQRPARGGVGNGKEKVKGGTPPKEQDKIDDSMKKLPGESTADYIKRMQEKFGKK